MKSGERMRWVLALGIGLALHALLLLIPVNRTADPGTVRSVEVDVQWVPPPEPVPTRRAPPERPLESLPPTPPAAETARSGPAGIRSEPAPVTEPVSDPVPSIRPSIRPAASAVSLMAEALLEDQPGPEALFGPGREAVDPAPALAWQVPERQGLDEMLDRPLPSLPFADPELVDFMYAPGVMGEAHRLFDQITPEFGWTSKTGFKIRCRFVLVVIGCGWGR